MDEHFTGTETTFAGFIAEGDPACDAVRAAIQAGRRLGDHLYFRHNRQGQGRDAVTAHSRISLRRPAHARDGGERDRVTWRCDSITPLALPVVPEVKNDHRDVFRLELPPRTRRRPDRLRQ